MRVTMRRSTFTLETGRVSEGHSYDVPDELGQLWVDRKLADPATDEAPEPVPGLLPVLPPDVVTRDPHAPLLPAPGQAPVVEKPTVWPVTARAPRSGAPRVARTKK